MSSGGAPSDLPAALHAASYVAELVKFTLIPSASLFALLKSLLDEFSHAHVQLACALLDGCGKWL